MTAFFAVTAAWLVCWTIILVKARVEQAPAASLTILDSLELKR